MTEKDLRWNKFVQDVCFREIESLSEIQRKAAAEGENDDWSETDSNYYKFSPSLCDCLQKFIEDNKDVIFD